MKKLSTLLYLLIISICSSAQGPWDNDLFLTFSTDGTNFTGSTFFEDSSDVPSIALLDDGTLICAFQWFPGTTDGSVAVKTSTDNGQTWTSPTFANFINQPAGLFKPVDPTIVNLGGGQMRMYFSIGTSMITDSTLDVYSAISSDGINFTYETSTAVYSDSVEIIEPAVGLVNGTWHCLHAIGAPWEGATQSTSATGLNFSQAPHVNSDTMHTWIGNFLNDGGTSKFYGSADAIWWASTEDGISWSPYQATNVFGGSNPGITKMSDSTYVMVYVKKNQPPLGIEEISNSIQLFPNPFTSQLTIQLEKPVVNGTLTLYNNSGQAVKIISHLDQQTIILERDGLANGLYFIQLTDGEDIILNEKVIVSE